MQYERLIVVLSKKCLLRKLKSRYIMKEGERDLGCMYCTIRRLPSRRPVADSCPEYLDIIPALCPTFVSGKGERFKV